MTATPLPLTFARVVPIEGTWNFRDVGGYRTASGSRVKRRLLYRSDALHRLTRYGRKSLEALQLRTVCDLRMPNERRGMLDRLPIDVRALHLPLYPIPDMDPTPAQRVWGFLSGKYRMSDVTKLIADSYRHIVGNQAPQLGRVLLLLAEHRNLPVLVHCQGGRDRTGLVIAIVHLLLGVTLEDVFDDFLLTNRLVAQHRDHLLRTLRLLTFYQVPSRELQLVLEARREHLQGALELIRKRSLSLEEFLVDAAKLRPETIAALRANLLE